MELGRFMGGLHPLLIHFPIALLIAALLFELVAFFRSDRALGKFARLVLLLGMVTTLVAFVCGNFAEIWAARAGISQAALERHEILATVTSWTFVGLTAWRMLMGEGTSRRWMAAWLAAAACACTMILYTGHQGAALVYEHGAAVQNIGPQRPPSHDDLATLLQRQDADSIFYSNLMHHVFGWLVLVLAGLLLLDRTAPEMGKRARQLGPLLLMAGGIFLLIFSDLDAWPLYRVQPLRPITDKEVLLHKTYALLMIAIGLRGLWLFFHKRRSAAPEEVVQTAPPDWRSQDRLMAVFALVGGALLFTHVHSAAPYANVAIGVYIHHTVMGLVALAIGAVKLMDDAASRPSRGRTLAYPALMVLEAIFLIRYNEGLPWFLGHARFSTVAPHGGLVAPFGRDRAELLFDPAVTRFELLVLKPDSAEPSPLQINEIKLIVRTGDDSTEVTLLENSGSIPSGRKFIGDAPFLRGASLFTARAYAEIDGRERVAAFEPWIDRRLVAQANLAYSCPMHPAQGGAKPGRCAVCGMACQPARSSRPAGVLHDPHYVLDFAVSPPRPMPARASRLTFAVKETATGKIVPLDIVHTRKMHVMVVSKGLAHFDHIHPAEQADGRYAIDYVFPPAGDYVIFADVTPRGDVNQVFRQELRVGGGSPVAPPLRPSLASARLFGDYRVALTLPARCTAGEEATLTFTLFYRDRPVTDLEPFLGAGGHCVLISQDGRDYLHSHPLEPDGVPTRGPQLDFHTRFPHPGLYKAWLQFQHAGKAVTADFALRVE